MLLLQPTHLQAIRMHAEETYPHECCGLILGHTDMNISASAGSADISGSADSHSEVKSTADSLSVMDETTRRPMKTVVELWPMTNAWDEEAQSAMTAVAESETPYDHSHESTQPLTTRRRYWIDPKDMLAAQKYARQQGVDIIGIYHSHPDHPAVPSECDRACAWPEYSYIIVSVAKGEATDTLSWTLDDDHQFQSEVLQVNRYKTTHSHRIG